MRFRAAVAAAALPAVILAAGGAEGRTFLPVERRCPFTGTKFSAEVDASGTRICQRLDLKPVGFTGAPPLLPVCPDDGFVMFKDELTPEEVERLRPWVASEEFRRMTEGESTYYRVAETLRRLGEPRDRIAWRLLQASWQVEADGEKYRRYLKEALRELDQAAAAPAQGSGGHEPASSPDVAAVLAGELERRLGLLDAARERFAALGRRADLPETLAKVVEWELELVAAGDSGPHYLPRESEDRCRQLD